MLNLWVELNLSLQTGGPVASSSLTNTSEEMQK